MRFKKFFSVLICLILVVMSAIVVSADGGVCTVSGDDEFVYGNENVTVTFSFDAGEHPLSAVTTIDFDNDIFKFVSLSGADYVLKSGQVIITDERFASTDKGGSYEAVFKAIGVGKCEFTYSGNVITDNGEVALDSGSKTIEARNEKNSDATLSEINLRGANDLAMSDDVAYGTVPYEKTSIVITATPSQGDATVKGSGTFDLEVGENVFELVVTAPDGVTTKTYYVKITRLDENGENVVAVPNGTYEAVIDDKQCPLISDLTGISIGDGYNIVTVKYGDKYINAFSNDDEDFYGVMIKVDGENILYNYDPEQSTFKKATTFDFNGTLLYALDASEYVAPSGMSLGTVELMDDCYIKVFSYTDEAYIDLYIVMCYNGTDIQFYRYDSANGAITREPDFNPTTKALDKILDRSKAQVDGRKELSTTGKILVILIALFAISLILFIMLIIVRARDGYRTSVSTSQFVTEDEYNVKNTESDALFLSPEDDWEPLDMENVVNGMENMVVTPNPGKKKKK